ncbi:conserved hypothetical protein [Aeromicrobium sp. 9AM]|nr:conserved hypothetical protein [Aeromicrobium sp. 9AM]
MHREFSTTSRLVTVCPDLPADEARLLRRTVAPFVEPAGDKYFWSSETYIQTDNCGPLIPLISVAPEQYVYAFEWPGDGSHGLRLSLPEETTDHREWFRYFLKRLREVDPVHFPADPDWRTTPEWATNPLLEAVNALAAIEAARETAMTDFDARSTAAEQAIEAEAASAAAGHQRLLTATGTDLEKAVASAFEDLGFTVQEMDETHKDRQGVALEDLRLFNGEPTDWTCLVEVKGWTGGFKSNEVSQVVVRPTTQFVLDEQRVPEKVLLVFNQHRLESPTARPVPAISNPALDLAPLEPFNGAAIDTRDLFRALRDVSSKVVGPDEIRSSIIGTTGLWSWPASPSE